MGQAWGWQGARTGNHSAGQNLWRLTSQAGQQFEVFHPDRWLFQGAILRLMRLKCLSERPLVFDGPFVLDSPAALQKAHDDDRWGKMGTLDGVPH